MKLIISKKLLVLTIVILVALLIVGIYYSGVLTNQEPQKVNIEIGNSPVEGSPDSKVTMAIFTDFECPFCGRFARDTLPLIKSEYVDTGKVRLVLKSFPLPMHEFAEKAAEAGYCANEQGKFWEYHDVLFNNQIALAVPFLKQYAVQVGMNSTQFNQCLDSGKYSGQVSTDSSDGMKYGVSSTPTIFVNGIKIEGALPFGTFKQAIDSELAK
jgi:protein-disulfide isomerase